MPNKAYSALAKLALALGAVAAALAARELLTPWLGATFPLATMFTAIAFVVWKAGWEPALGTAVGGWVAAALVFRGGFGYFNGLTVNEIVGFLVYMLACVPIIVLGEAMRRAQRDLEARQAELSATNLELASKIEAQSLLAAIVASSEDAIISKTLEGVITSWNRGAELLFGWTAAEAIGQSIHLIVPPEFREQERTILDRLRLGDRIQEMQVERKRKDGSRVDVSITISPVRDRHGDIIGASKTARDITARKRWEEQLLRSEEALQEADRRKDEFLATLAHELRNPLAPISSGLHILRSAADRGQRMTALEIMERQVNQMVRLVDDLLDVARITTGKVEIRHEPIDIATAINDAIETSQPLVGERHERLTILPPPQPVFVSGDRTRLAQVFANLLNNSAKYSEPGQPISIAFGRDGDQVVIRITDAGSGIHPDMIPRVFDMFRQADRTGGRSRGGLGIGLSLVKRIVELHGGTVSARSEGLGLGSEFTVRLPAIEVRQAALAPAPMVSGAATRRRILVVDDNADAAESLAALLSIGGHETRMAHDGPEALQQAERFHPDVVFLDIGMPTLDGHETAKLIRRQPWGKQMVLVALTGWGQSEDRRRSKDAGFNHHLVKPADPAVVEKLLSSI
jgi:two-component system, chemotaxis family, CheB/CheR fusion protein